MKKILLIALLSFALANTSSAQFEFENIFGGATIGYAKPLGDFSEYAKGGFAYEGHLGYNLNDNLAVGIEYSATITAAIDPSGSTGLLGVNLYGLSNYFAKGWYYFLEDDFKPYAAVGLGASLFAEPDLTVNEEVFPGAKRTGFGGLGELGFFFNGFNLSYGFVYGGNTAKEPVYNDQIANKPIMYHRFMIGYTYRFDQM